MTYQKDPERRDPLRRDDSNVPAMLIIVGLIMVFGAMYLVFSYRSDPHGPTVTGQRTEAPLTPGKP